MTGSWRSGRGWAWRCCRTRPARAGSGSWRSGCGGGLVALLCERDLTGSGIEVEFFGEPTRIMGGPAALAEQNGAVLMPVTLWYEGENWGAHIHQEIPVPETGTGQEKIAAVTRQLARVFEDGIARHPEDWHMLQKVFVADLGTGRLRAAGQQLPPAG